MPFLSASVIYRHIFVMKSVLVTIRREVKLVPGRETGGPLVGYLTGDGAIVVTHAGGPGPNAVHARYSMEVDGAHAQRFCDGLRNATDGRLDYVGDWHNHPGFSLKPSTHDVAAIRTMANLKRLFGSSGPGQHPRPMTRSRNP